MLEPPAERREVMIVEIRFSAEMKSPAEKPNDILNWSYGIRSHGKSVERLWGMDGRLRDGRKWHPKRNV